MSYCIYNTDKQKYFACIDGKKIWTADVEQAQKFKNSATVSNYMSKNLKVSTAGKLHGQSIVAVVYYRGSVTENGFVSEISSETADTYMESIPEALISIKETVQMARKLQRYYRDCIQAVDLELEDLLHKAEFETPNVVGGYKIYKAIHDARVRRRYYKDCSATITCLFSAGVGDKLIELPDKLEQFQNGIANRKYTPRMNAE